MTKEKPKIITESLALFADLVNDQGFDSSPTFDHCYKLVETKITKIDFLSLCQKVIK